MLHWSKNRGFAAAARWLVEELGAPGERGNKDGRTALMWAGRNGELGAARWLIDDAGADVRATNKNGTTMLHWAIWGESVAAAQVRRNLSHGPRTRSLPRIVCAAAWCLRSARRWRLRRRPRR